MSRNKTLTPGRVKVIAKIGVREDARRHAFDMIDGLVGDYKAAQIPFSFDAIRDAVIDAADAVRGREETAGDDSGKHLTVE